MCTFLQLKHPTQTGNTWSRQPPVTETVHGHRSVILHWSVSISECNTKDYRWQGIDFHPQHNAHTYTKSPKAQNPLNIFVCAMKVNIIENLVPRLGFKSLLHDFLLRLQIKGLTVLSLFCVDDGEPFLRTHGRSSRDSKWRLECGEGMVVRRLRRHCHSCLRTLGIHTSTTL